MKKFFAYAIALIVIVFMAGPQQAQAQRIDLAPNIGYGFDVFNQVGDPGSVSIGPQFHIYLREGVKRDDEHRRFSLILNPGLDYYLFDINGMSGFQLDINALVALRNKTITPENTIKRRLVMPYVGLGLALSIVTGEEDPTGIPPGPPENFEQLCPENNPAPCLLSEVESGTALGLNLVGGVLWGRGSPRVITQLRYSLGSHELHRDQVDFSPSSGLQFHGGIMFVINN